MALGGEPKTTCDLLGAKVTEKWCAMFDGFGEVCEDAKGDSDLAAGLEREFIGEDLSALEIIEGYALEVDCGTLAVMGGLDGLMVDL